MIVIRFSTRRVDQTEIFVATVMGREDTHPVNLNDRTCVHPWSEDYPRSVRGLYLENFAHEIAYYPCSVYPGHVASYVNTGHRDLFRLERHTAKGAAKAFDKLDRAASRHVLDISEPGDAVQAMALAFGASQWCATDDENGFLYSHQRWTWGDDIKAEARRRAAATRRIIEDKL